MIEMVLKIKLFMITLAKYVQFCNRFATTSFTSCKNLLFSPLMNSTASTLDTTSSNVTYREETQESSSSSDESTLSIKSNPNQFVQNAEQSSSSSSSEPEPELTPVKKEIESEMKTSEEIVTSVMRVKLNDREDEVDSARIEKSEIAAAQSAFEDGLTTTDELDEEIIENHIYIFKVSKLTFFWMRFFMIDRLFPHDLLRKNLVYCQ